MPKTSGGMRAWSLQRAEQGLTPLLRGDLVLKDGLAEVITILLSTRSSRSCCKTLRFAWQVTMSSWCASYRRRRQR